MNNDLVGLILVAALILLNGFFVSAEFALVSVRRTRVEELLAQKKPGAQVLQEATHHVNRFIAATQLGITLASLGLGWVGEPALAHLIEPLLDLIPVPLSWASVTAHGISAGIAFAAITFLHVVLGELVPKSMALQRAERIALLVAQPMSWITTVFKPGIWVLNRAGDFVLRLLGFNAASGHEMVHSVEEIKLVMAASADQGVLGDAEFDMVDSIFDLREMMIRQVMIPRTEITALAADSTLRDAIALHKGNRHGKFPVYEKDIDHISAVLYIRDIIEELSQGKLDSPIQQFTREAIFLPETAKVNAALTTFRDKRQHVAIVLDEYGGTAGFITLEDLLEEIAGEVPDQFDEEQRPDIVRRPDGKWEVSGLALIEEVNDALAVTLNDENYDTIGGYVMGKLERIPHSGDQVIIDHIHFEVEHVDGMRVDRLLISVTEGPQQTAP